MATASSMLWTCLVQIVDVTATAASSAAAEVSAEADVVDLRRFQAISTFRDAEAEALTATPNMF